MLVAITGASGLVGTALQARLKTEGHTVRPLARGQGKDWDPDTGWIRPAVLEGVDAIVHLSGASIGEGRWSAKRKRELVDSRVGSTRLLITAMSGMEHPPALISASAIGYYGNRGDQVLDETSGKGDGFLAGVVQQWEDEVAKAEAIGARTVRLRFGVVLAKEGGALNRMILPFKFGAGGRLGSGKQWFSWVTLHDLTRVIATAVTDASKSGVYNVTAPEPVTNRELTKALAKAVHRPAIFPVPPFALRLLLGEAADELLLYSQRVLPRRLAEEGFDFDHKEIGEALHAVLGAR
jgi:uncharacterized protein (TIGR01777 family)